jgi:hypothetical protein
MLSPLVFEHQLANLLILSAASRAGAAISYQAAGSLMTLKDGQI